MSTPNKKVKLGETDNLKVSAYPVGEERPDGFIAMGVPEIQLVLLQRIHEELKTMNKLLGSGQLALFEIDRHGNF